MYYVKIKEIFEAANQLSHYYSAFFLGQAAVGPRFLQLIEVSTIAQICENVEMRMRLVELPQFNNMLAGDNL